MAYSNGALPRTALAPITVAANGQQAYLRKDAAKAFNAMNAESVARFGVVLRVSSARTAYRPLADQWYFWNLYKSGRGALAARPGTSNHGWGVAIDLATPQMREIVNKIGEKYGWAKKWSDAQGEWWHLKWREGVWNGVSKYGKPTIRPGAKGINVLRLKRAMYRKGLREFNRYTPVYTGRAVDAIKRLQRKHGLHADGIVGPATWKLLNA